MAAELPYETRLHQAREALNREDVHICVWGDSFTSQTTNRVPYHLLRGLFGPRITAVSAGAAPSSNVGLPYGLLSVGGSGASSADFGSGFCSPIEYTGPGLGLRNQRFQDGSTNSTTNGVVFRVNYVPSVLGTGTAESAFKASRNIFVRPFYYCPAVGVTGLSDTDWEAWDGMDHTFGELYETVNLRENALQENGSAGAPLAQSINALVRSDGSDWLMDWAVAAERRLTLTDPSNTVVAPGGNVWWTWTGCLLYEPSGSGWNQGRIISIFSDSSRTYADMAANALPVGAGGRSKQCTNEQIAWTLRLCTPPGGENAPIYAICHLDSETTITVQHLLDTRDNLAASAALVGKEFLGVCFFASVRKMSTTLEQEMAFSQALFDASESRDDISVFSLARKTGWADFSTISGDSLAYLQENGYENFSYGGTSGDLTAQSSLDNGHPTSVIAAAWIMSELDRAMQEALAADVVVADSTISIDTTTLTAEVTGGASPITYAWSVVSKPSGSTVTFTDSDSATTAATFSSSGSYTLRVTITDANLSSVQVDTEITVSLNQFSRFYGGSIATASAPVLSIEGQEKVQQFEQTGDRAFRNITDVVYIRPGEAVSLGSPYSGAEIRYTLNGKSPTKSSPKYEAPLVFWDNGAQDVILIKARLYPQDNPNALTYYGTQTPAVVATWRLKVV